MYKAQVLADSVSPQGARLTSIQVTYPHAIHKDIMTHRAFSRNFQSFRAFPPEKVIKMIEEDPFIPEAFESRVVGMGQGQAIDNQDEAVELWNKHIADSIATAQAMIKLDLAKAQVNFVLQDLTWITGIITATEWQNFWDLRLAWDMKADKPKARPEVYKIAKMMFDEYSASYPRHLSANDWHLPYGNDHAPDWDKAKAVDAARCARNSYLTHDGEHDTLKDMGLHDSLLSDKHMSPFEHQAKPALFVDNTIQWHGPLRGWRSYRAEIEGF